MRGMLGPRVVTVENDDRGIPAVFEDVLAKIGAQGRQGKHLPFLFSPVARCMAKCTFP